MTQPIFRVYLRFPDQTVSHKTNTVSQAAALVAFSELVNDVSLDGTKCAAVLSFNNRQMAFHKFDVSAEDQDYWRGRLNEISTINAAR